jgi:GNAT superfamily N-acetyltransferase
LGYLVFKHHRVINLDFLADKKIEFVVWKPGIFRFVPKGLPMKYFYYWLAHYFYFFKNKSYQSILTYCDGKLACSYLIVPGYFRWPFMGKEDLQLTYVKTYPDFRGKGIATKAINFGVDFLMKRGKKNMIIWYVTDDSNPASIKLAQKCGFIYHAKGIRTYLFGIRQLKVLQILR